MSAQYTPSLNPQGSLSTNGENGSSTNTDQGLQISIKDGSFVKYDVTGSFFDNSGQLQQIDGTMKIEFSNVTSKGYEQGTTVVGIPFMEDSSKHVWLNDAQSSDGDIMSKDNYLGNEYVTLSFGKVEADHYQNTTQEGTTQIVNDHYVDAKTGMPYMIDNQRQGYDQNGIVIPGEINTIMSNTNIQELKNGTSSNSVG